MSASEPEREREDTGTEPNAAPVDRPFSIGPDFDYDAAFAALVAQFGTTPRSAVDGESTPRIDSHIHPDPDTPHDSGAGDPEQAWAPPELDEHFDPPDPPPIPRGDMIARVAWTGVLGGPALLVVAAAVRDMLPSWMVVGALVAFIAGFATLVARMPADRDEDGDDGAVV